MNKHSPNYIWHRNESWFVGAFKFKCTGGGMSIFYIYDLYFMHVFTVLSWSLYSWDHYTDSYMTMK